MSFTLDGRELSLGFDAKALYLGIDDDDEDLVQYVHACYPYPEGSLCGSKRLWFRAEITDDEKLSLVTCEDCLLILKAKKET